MYMSQLTETDFDDAAHLRGIGISTAENLRKVYCEFYNIPFISEDSAEADDKYLTHPIDRFSLSQKVRKRLKHLDIHSLEDLLTIDEEQLKSIRNLSSKTAGEILAFRDAALLSGKIGSKMYSLEGVAPENKPIPIFLFHSIGLSKQAIDLLWDGNIVTVSDLCGRELSLQEYSIARSISSFISVPVTQHFADAVEALDKRAGISLSMRSKGAAIEEIGEELEIARERVRQILVRACRKLTGTAELVAGMLLSTDKSMFSVSDLICLFGSEETAVQCSLVLQESAYVRYHKISNSFTWKEKAVHDMNLALFDRE